MKPIPLTIYNDDEFGREVQIQVSGGGETRVFPLKPRSKDTDPPPAHIEIDQDQEVRLRAQHVGSCPLCGEDEKEPEDMPNRYEVWVWCKGVKIYGDQSGKRVMMDARFDTKEAASARVEELLAEGVKAQFLDRWQVERAVKAYGRLPLGRQLMLLGVPAIEETAEGELDGRAV